MRMDRAKKEEKKPLLLQHVNIIIGWKTKRLKKKPTETTQRKMFLFAVLFIQSIFFRSLTICAVVTKNVWPKKKKKDLIFFSSSDSGKQKNRLEGERREKRVEEYED